MKPLQDIRVLTGALNLPGPVACARLFQMGATITKVEPPQGDPLEQGKLKWYRELHRGVEIIRLNLKDPQDRSRLDPLLEKTDLLVTATRPAALARLGLSWAELHARFPHLGQVAIVGYPPPSNELPGHDLSYQARVGLVTPPHLPRTVLADLAGAQEVVSMALGLILARERGLGCHYLQVSLAEAACRFSEPLRYGLTAPGGLLGGGFPGYNLYRCRDGWIALAALEPHFWLKLAKEFCLQSPTQEQLELIFQTQTAQEWETWGVYHDLPIVAVRDAPPNEENRG
ncbi:MAG TPA: CoA transferase [Gemmataceae bacterium]|nr:CoA transferase [Gemmataceae bacterium]